MQFIAEALTQAAFKPFGQVFSAPTSPGRSGPIARLDNQRPEAIPTLTTSCIQPVTLPATIGKLERHPKSSQAFIPLDLARFLIVVAPNAADGNPDIAAARAFVGTGDQAFNYDANIWHSGFMGLDRMARYAVLIWRAGTEDEIFIDLPAPLSVTA